MRKLDLSKFINKKLLDAKKIENTELKVFEIKTKSKTFYSVQIITNSKEKYQTKIKTKKEALKIFNDLILLKKEL